MYSYSLQRSFHMDRRRPVRTIGPALTLALAAASIFYDEPSLPLPGFSAPNIDAVARPPRLPPPFREVSANGALPAEMKTRSEGLGDVPRGGEAYVTLDHLILDHLFFSEVHELLDGRHERQPSILAKSLERSGAKHLNLWTEEGLQQMTFGMDLKIPWQRVETVESWSGTGDRNESLGNVDQVGEMIINCTVKSLHSTNHSRLLEMSFAMDGPSVLQQLRPKLLLQLKPRAHGLEVWIGGLLEWKVHCHFLIRRPMEHGFLLGLGRLSRALVEELRTAERKRILLPSKAMWRDSDSTGTQPFLFRAIGLFTGLLHA